MIIQLTALYCITLLCLTGMQVVYFDGIIRRLTQQQKELTMAVSQNMQLLNTAIGNLIAAYQNVVGQEATDAASIQTVADDETAAQQLTASINAALNPTPAAPSPAPTPTTTS